MFCETESCWLLTYYISGHVQSTKLIFFIYLIFEVNDVLLIQIVYQGSIISRRWAVAAVSADYIGLSVPTAPAGASHFDTRSTYVCS